MEAALEERPPVARVSVSFRLPYVNNGCTAVGIWPVVVELPVSDLAVQDIPIYAEDFSFQI